MAIQSVVLVREVWDTRDLVGAVLDDRQTVNEGALATRFEPQDLNALELALRLKDDHGGTVTAMAAGTPRDVDVLRECLYRGVDSVRRIDADPRVLDTQALAHLFAQAIRNAGDVDLILTGMTLIEDENSLLGPHVAAQLGARQLTYVDDIDALGDGTVVGKRSIEMGYEYVEVSLPAVLSVGVALVEDDPRTPRTAKAMLKLKAKKIEIPVMSAADLGTPDPTTLCTTDVAAHEAVEERVIESTVVDPESEDALKRMLAEVLKGE